MPWGLMVKIKQNIYKHIPGINIEILRMNPNTSCQNEIQYQYKHEYEFEYNQWNDSIQSKRYAFLFSLF